MVKLEGDKEISIKMNKEFIERLDKLAHMGKISRRQLLKNFLEVGVIEVEGLKDIGIFQAAIFIRDLQEKRSGIKKMPAIVGGEIPIPIKIDEEFLYRLDKLAERADLSRHQLMKNILLVGVEETEALAKLGIVQMVIIIHDLPESFAKFFKVGEKALKAVGLTR